MRKALLSLSLLTSWLLSTPSEARHLPSEKDILGVWKLSKFVLSDASGQERPWCEGASGTIAYLPGQMFVAINCENSEPGSAAANMNGMLFYSGPFELDQQTGEVIHRVRNFSHPDLNRVFRRKVEIDDGEHLRLSGNLGGGKKVVVEWHRQERFAYDAHPLTGVWELVGSENEVPGVGSGIPFCSGFSGLILYTPGGYNAVAINCGPKANDHISEPADQFGRKFFYAGTYTAQGNQVTQTPSNASETALIGQPALRQMKIADDMLTLEGTNGSKFRAQWRKRHSFVGL